MSKIRVPLDGSKARQKGFYMFYYGSEREINVGDRVRCIGSWDGLRIDELTGTVRDINSCDIGIEFDGEIPRGHDLGAYRTDRGWYVTRRQVIFVSDVPTEVDEGKKNCRHCGKVLDKSAFTLGAVMFPHYCDDCVRDKLKITHKYHWGRDTIKYACEKGKITLGAEIEIDDYEQDGDADAILGEVLRSAERMHMPAILHGENDGSLSGNGVECVTAPLTVKQWASDGVREQIRVLLDSACKNGFTFDENDNAGLHVHIGRKELCGDDRAVSDAVGLLMGWAVTALWNKGFDRLSRRNDIEYAHLFTDDCKLRSLYNTSALCDRYYCVNIQNRNTLELRIFKGARTVDDVLLAVDMCYMLAKWATKKINAFMKRGAYTVRDGKYDDATEYAERVTWGALVKYSKFPEITLPEMRKYGINV